jgi:hypothetical protein
MNLAMPICIDDRKHIFEAFWRVFMERIFGEGKNLEKIL